MIVDNPRENVDLIEFMLIVATYGEQADMGDVQDFANDNGFELEDGSDIDVAEILGASEFSPAVAAEWLAGTETWAFNEAFARQMGLVNKLASDRQNVSNWADWAEVKAKLEDLEIAFQWQEPVAEVVAGW